MTSSIRSAICARRWTSPTAITKNGTAPVIPRGCETTQIPLPARIFAVVDVWDALLHDRPYRSAWTREQGIAYIREQSGIHFDPAVVEAFLQLVED